MEGREERKGVAVEGGGLRRRGGCWLNKTLRGGGVIADRKGAEREGSERERGRGKGHLNSGSVAAMPWQS